MLETCKSCGTVFEVDENTITNNIKWLKCCVCNKKWIISSRSDKISIQENSEIKSKSEKVREELASIKSVVEDKSKILAKKPNPVLDQKNKSVAEIASELSISKLNEIENKPNKPIVVNDKNKVKRISILPFFIIAFGLAFFFAIYFRSTLISYSFLYFPSHTENYIKKINNLLNIFQLPISSEINNLNLIDFIATVQEKEVRFTGVIKNSSKRPMLVPRINILAIREDRKIILEKVLILDDKIIPPNSKISFSKVIKEVIQNNRENITVKAILVKKVFDY